jgi:hypothetical protein
MRLDQVTQYIGVKNIAGVGINFTYQLHDQIVIVPVVVGVVTLAKHGIVLFIRPSRIEEAVRGVKMLLAEDRYFHWLRNRRNSIFV